MSVFEVKVLELDEWNTPASTYQPKTLDGYRLSEYTFIPGYYSYHGIEGIAFFYVSRALSATKLEEFKCPKPGYAPKWCDWMVDSPTDYRAMQIYAERAYGKVLTTGLGLGLVTHELCKNSKVESITIIERSSAVIELIANNLPEDSRIKIVNEDFWEFIDLDDSKWDTIIVDLWVFWGPAQQFKQYKEEVVPANEKMRAKYPEAQIVFHGFEGLPNIEEVSKAFMAGAYTAPMIYGLQEAQ